MYVTAQELIDKYGADLLVNLTIKEPTGNDVPDQGIIDREIARVTGTIDGYLRNRYILPLSEVPPELAGYAEDMAIARLYSCLPERTVPEDVARNAKAAMDWLKDVQKGNVTLSIATLPPASTGEPGTTGFFKTSKQSSDRIFSDATLDQFSGR